MDKKPFVIIIAPFLPYPTNSGGKVRLVHTLTELSKQFKIRLLAFYESEFEITQNKLFFEEKGIEYSLYNKQSRKFFSFFTSGIPYWFSSWRNTSLINNLKKENFLHQKPKFIQIETTQLLYLVDYLPKKIKKVYVAYDVSSISFWRRFKEESNFIKLIVKFLRCIEIYVYELFNIKKMDVVISVSNNDKTSIKKYFHHNCIKCVANGIESISTIQKDKHQMICLGYIGSFQHSPNKKAVEYFIDKIAPNLEKNSVRFKFFIAGENNQVELTRIIQESDLVDKSQIVDLQYVANIRDFYSKIDCLVAPIFSGSGTRLKILESLSFYNPVLTTEVGIEGIDIISPYIQVLRNCDDPEIWTSAIKNIHSHGLANNDTELKNQLEKYLWTSIFDKYLDTINTKCLA